jgi:hypothetical protein
VHRAPTIVLNPSDAAALDELVGPLPEGAVTVSEPVREFGEPVRMRIVPNRADRRRASRAKPRS